MKHNGKSGRRAAAEVLHLRSDGVACMKAACRPPLFRKRKFEPIVIVTCVLWYCRFAISLRDLEELMAERGLSVDHTTIWRWTQTYGAEVYRLLRGEVKWKSST